MSHTFTHRLSRRSVRLSMVAAAASLAVWAMPPLVRAQVAEDPALKEVENAKFSTSGVIVSNAVFIRCGPGDNYYPTIKLDKGAKVQVVGAKFDWLKIVPPEGSFCYVARLYVDRHGDGKVGRVNKDSINVRAGSSLSALKIGILCELNQGEDVEILGEEQEYFRIKPPAKAYLYVNKKYVEPDPDAKPQPQIAKADPVKAVEPAPTPTPPTGNDPKTEAPKTTDAGKGGDVAGADFGAGDPAKTYDKVHADSLIGDSGKPGTATDTGGKPEMVKPTVTTPQPGTDTGGAAKGEADPNSPDAGKTDAPSSSNPSTEAPRFEVPKGETPTKATTVTPKADATPTAAEPVKPALPKIDVSTPEAAETAFGKAEAEFNTTRNQPLDKQPLESLVRQFEAVAGSDALPESLRRIADSRLATVKVRASAQAELIAARKSQSDLKQKQMALEAEQQELQKRLAENSVKVYTAVGTLQASSLQQGPGTLFRVTDPATGRTVCYLRSNDAKTITLVGQFVGIKGALQEEQRLGARVITPTDITPCDPGKVHQTITAQIIPPSLMPREPAQAVTDPQPPQP